jgi:DcmR-like sensory protein/helix-turn-helix protein
MGLRALRGEFDAPAVLCNNPPARGSRVIFSISLLNTKEAARFLRVSEASMRRWSDAGLLPVQRVGRRRERRFSQPDLVRFLNQPTGDRTTIGRQAPAATVTLGGVSVPIRSHLAPIYSTDMGGLRLSVPFLAEGIRAGQPCFLAATRNVLDRYLTALSEEHGIDLEEAVRARRLLLLSGAESVGDLERLFGKALASGHTVLRVVGEMASIRQMFASDAEMMALEEAYEIMAKRFPAVSLCQYDSREFSGETILRALKAHPDMFVQHLGGFLN